MAPHVSEARIKLGYPLYAGDFDPLNPDFLLVGGGGGSSSTGVPNKITLLDASRPYELAEIADIELAKNEDSVTTLAVASSSETSISAIAGINSSVADQIAGRNEHLRSFRIGLPARKRRADGTEVAEKAARALPTQALGKTALFKSAVGPKNETYQRVLRASPIQASNEPRITAVASGLAPENEIIAFQPVMNNLTSTVDEISRISLGTKEAADVDVLPIKGNGHVLAYCTDDSVYIQQLPNTKGSQIDVPSRIYQCPDSTESTPSSKRPRFRALRFLTPKHILLLQNRPGRTGAALLILKINITGNGHITLYKRLHSSIKLATGLDTAILRSSLSEDFQAVIAVASQDGSVEILTLDSTLESPLTQYRQYALLREVHSGPLTRLVLSNFVVPTNINKDTPPQRLKLATACLDTTIAVHTLPLKSYPSSTSKTARYVLTSPGRSEALQTTFSVFTAIVVVVIAALFMQIFCEIRGALPPTLGIQEYLPPSIREKIARPYYPDDHPVVDKASEALESAINAIKDAPNLIPTSINVPSTDDMKEAVDENVVQPLSDLVSSASALPDPEAAAIVVRDTGSDLTAELHHDAEVVKQETLKKWEDLTAKEKKGWKVRLMETGHWVEQQGETVLKGVLFSELAGVVGEALRG